jgi:hypothetical protein
MHKHHVVPRSRGGTEDSENLVIVSSYDHALIHALDFLEGGPRFDFRHEAWPLLPDELREALRAEQSKRMSERVVSDDTKAKIGESSRDRMLAGLASYAASFNKDKPKSKDHKTNIGNALRGVPKTETHRAAMLPHLQNLNTIVTVCPHCGKEGKGPSMKKWHFDRCRTQLNGQNNKA